MMKITLKLSAMAMGLFLMVSCLYNEKKETKSVTKAKVQLPEVSGYPIVDTNQKFCYDTSSQINCPSEGVDYFGQDAQYNGLQPSFKDNGDGTITDNNTGLMWAKNQSDKTIPWGKTENYCQNLTVGDYSDWRMPTVKELWSLRDFSKGWPWLDTKYFNLSSDGTQMRYHHTWTSDAYLIESEYQNRQVQGEPHWIVNDWTGHIKAMEGHRFVRAVRGNPNYGVNEFVDNKDGTVTDKATGLMWAKDDNGKELYWNDALVFSENSELAGFTDWRLPNIKELQSIADYSATKIPAMDTKYFNLTKVTNSVEGTEQENYPFYWSSTSIPFVDTGVKVVDAPPHHEDEDTGNGIKYAWFLASGYNVDMDGYDLHGAGSICFGAKAKEDAGIENSVPFMVRLVRDVK